MSTSQPDMTQTDSARTGRVQRHKLIDRIYHWLMALSVLILIVSAFLPIFGWKFAWLDLHWTTGVVLTIAVLFHIVRAVCWQDIWAMFIDVRDLRTLTGGGSGKPGKYTLAQKLYHLGVSLLILAAIGTGLLMLRKIDTPLWSETPIGSTIADGARSMPFTVLRPWPWSP
jgi:cytochrome b subunit of formate dehydrogenase